MSIIDGKKIADEILEVLKTEFNSLGRRLKLVGVLVGDHPGSKRFLELKRKTAENLGVDFEIRHFPLEISNQDLKKEIKDICDRDSIHGVIIELPLPEHILTQDILDLISIEKDVDVLSQLAQGKFFNGNTQVLSPAVEAVRTIFELNHIELRSKTVAVFGYGLLVGRQISHWLAKLEATVIVINEHTIDPGELSRKADIIISGVGKAGLIMADMVKEGALVIDFGYENADGKITGDVDFENVSVKASLITPVPGGVGPLVVMAVFKNLLELNK